jgi:hypothetical protein
MTTLDEVERYDFTLSDWHSLLVSTMHQPLPMYRGAFAAAPS